MRVLKGHSSPPAVRYGGRWGPRESAFFGRRRFMAIRARTVVPLTLAVGAVLMLVVASMASATHPRPKGATPLRVSLVPAFNQCTHRTGHTGRPWRSRPVTRLSVVVSITVGTRRQWRAGEQGGLGQATVLSVFRDPRMTRTCSSPQSGTDIRCKGHHRLRQRQRRRRRRLHRWAPRRHARSGSRTTSAQLPPGRELIPARSSTFRTRHGLCSDGQHGDRFYVHREHVG